VCLLIQRLSLRDADSVARLRRAAYAEAAEFVVADPASLGWARADTMGLVLGVSTASELVSTMRGTILVDREDAVHTMECEFDVDRVSFPALLLGKGATVAGCQARGLHSVLRYLFLDAAAAVGIATVLGIVYEGAPRTSLMARLGYDLRPVQRHWYTDLLPLTRTIIGTLDAVGYATACDRLREMINFDALHLTIDPRAELAKTLSTALRDHSAAAHTFDDAAK